MHFPRFHDFSVALQYVVERILKARTSFRPAFLFFFFSNGADKRKENAQLCVLNALLSPLSCDTEDYTGVKIRESWRIEIVRRENSNN